MMSNSVKFKVKIEPALSSLNSLNFSQVFSCNISNATLTYGYSNGELIIDASNYTSTLQDENITLFFNPPPGDPLFASTPTSSLTFVVDPDNNLAAVYNSPEVYANASMYEKLAMVVMYLSLLVFGAGVVVAKFIGVEMMGVIQVSYIGLMIVNYLNPVLAPFSKISFVNGFNDMFSTGSASGAMPNRITALNYYGELARNLNYTTFLLVLPLLVSLVLYLVSRFSKKPKETRDQLYRYSQICLCEYGLTGCMFLLYQFVVSVFLFVIYNPGTSSSLFGVSIA